MKNIEIEQSWSKFSTSHLAIGGVMAGILLGILGLMFQGPLTFAGEFTKGLLGIDESISTEANGAVELRAEFAHSELDQPLSREQFSELLRGIAIAHSDQPNEGLEAVGKYALMGDGLAQYAVGTIYAFGNGLPIDGEEAHAWLELAAAQGHDGASQLAEVIENDPDWAARASYFASLRQVRSVDTGNQEVSTGSYLNRGGLEVEANETLSAPVDSYLPPRSARRDALLGRALRADRLADPIDAPMRHTPFGGRHPQSNTVMAPLDYGPPPLILNQSGPGTYSDQFGDVYVQAGPQGVTNTRTGEFSPRN